MSSVNSGRDVSALLNIIKDAIGEQLPKGKEQLIALAITNVIGGLAMDINSMALSQVRIADALERMATNAENPR